MNNLIVKSSFGLSLDVKCKFNTELYVDIPVPTPSDSYKTFSGTSMATPYVAGLIGTFKALQPNITTEEVYNILESTGIETTQTNKTGKLIQPAQSIELVLKSF